MEALQCVLVPTLMPSTMRCTQRNDTTSSVYVKSEYRPRVGSRVRCCADTGGGVAVYTE